MNKIALVIGIMFVLSGVSAMANDARVLFTINNDSGKSAKISVRACGDDEHGGFCNFALKLEIEDLREIAPGATLSIQKGQINEMYLETLKLSCFRVYVYANSQVHERQVSILGEIVAVSEVTGRYRPWVNGCDERRREDL